jgi:hypothetical protein
LDGRLLVHAEYGGVLRRLQVQPDDVGSFAFKVPLFGHPCSDAFFDLRVVILFLTKPSERPLSIVESEPYEPSLDRTSAAWPYRYMDESSSCAATMQRREYPVRHYAERF